MTNFLEIDGSYLEGGGQILRNALSFSAILKRPVRIYNIRANRPKPGLMNQHLYGLNLLVKITNGVVKGNQINSTFVEFSPGDIESDNFTVDTRTAASVTLVCQVALPVLFFGNRRSQLDLTGGTNVSMAPPVDYMTQIFCPNLEKFGARFDLQLLRRGYYPRGGGRCVVTVDPIVTFNAADISDFGTLTQIQGSAYVAGRLPKSIAYDMQHTAERELHRLWPDQKVKIEVYKEVPYMARDNGSGIILKASTSTGCTLGASALGEKRVDGHVLGSDVSREFCGYLKQEVCVDAHLQDQIIIVMALADGVSRIRTCTLTKHTRTAIFVAEQIGARFNIEYEESGQVIINCEGIGWRNKYLYKRV